MLNGGDRNPGEQHWHVTGDDGTVRLCTLHTATVLSCNCCAEFGRPLTKKVMSHCTIADKHYTCHGGVEYPAFRYTAPLERQTCREPWVDSPRTFAFLRGVFLGSQHPSPNAITLCNFEAQIWSEIITSRDAKTIF